MTKIEFYSDVYGLADAVPIVRPSSELPNWVSLARMDYKQQPKNASHIYRCPGIFDLFNYGFIIPAWHDITLTPTTNNFKWEIPDDRLIDLMGSTYVAEAHDSSTIGKHLPRPHWTHPCVLKINTPWNVLAPKGVKFLMTAVPYPDSYEFQAVSGILDPAISTSINIQLNWNINASYTIKAGTPLAHLIPLTEKKYDFVVRDKNENDEKWSLKRKYLNGMSYIINRARLKSAYEQQIKKPFFQFWK
jgi:hypothetical protein